MKLPMKNSRLEKILHALRSSGPVTIEEGITLHGRFQVTLDALTDFYARLVVSGCITRDGKHYTISAAAVAHFNPPAVQAPILLVPARKINAFSAPLHARYFVSSLGRREGSNDARSLPSRYAKLG